MRQANPDYVNSMGADRTDQDEKGNPLTNVDLTPVSFGGETFRNPCFWILVGVAGTLAVQYMLSKKRFAG